MGQRNKNIPLQVSIARVHHPRESTMHVYRAFNHATEEEFDIAVNYTLHELSKFAKMDVIYISSQRSIQNQASQLTQNDSSVSSFQFLRSGGEVIMDLLIKDGAPEAAVLGDSATMRRKTLDRLCNVVEEVYKQNDEISATMSIQTFVAMLIIVVQYEICLFIEEFRLWGKMQLVESENSEIHYHIFDKFHRQGLMNPASNPFESFQAFYNQIQAAKKNIVLLVLGDQFVQAHTNSEALDLNIEENLDTLKLRLTQNLDVLFEKGLSILMELTGGSCEFWCKTKIMGLYVRLQSTFTAFNIFMQPEMISELRLSSVLQRRLQNDISAFFGSPWEMSGITGELMLYGFIAVVTDDQAYFYSLKQIQEFEMLILMGSSVRPSMDCRLALLDESLIWTILRTHCYPRGNCMHVLSSQPKQDTLAHISGFS